MMRPTPVIDERGFFTRTFDADALGSIGIDAGSFVQDSQSRSALGTVRGLHLRNDGREFKIVRCSAGAIHDVVVDLRPGSPSFGRWQAFRLDDVTHQSVVIPPGCAHGFQALTDVVDVCYRMDAVYAPEFDATLAFDDEDIGCTWPLPVGTLSARDRKGESFRALLPRLRAWFGE